MDHLVRAHGVEIDVEHVAGERVVLHLLDEREAAALALTIGDFEVHEEVIARGVCEERGDLPGVDLERDGFVLAAIDDCGDEALLLDFLYRRTTDAGPGLRG